MGGGGPGGGGGIRGSPTGIRTAPSKALPGMPAPGSFGIGQVQYFGRYPHDKHLSLLVTAVEL